MGPRLRRPYLDDAVGSAGKVPVSKVTLAETRFQTHHPKNENVSNATSHSIVGTSMPTAALSPGPYSPHQLTQLGATPEDCRTHGLLGRTDAPRYDSTVVRNT